MLSDVPILLALPSRFTRGTVYSPAFLVRAALAVCLACALTWAFHYLLKKAEPLLDAHFRDQANNLDNLAPRFVDVAIVGSAALSLFLELAVIRWQGTVFEFFAFYKNFGALRARLCGA
jgi:hypothetical protein